MKFSQYESEPIFQLQNKINEIIDLLNQLKFTVTIKDPDQLQTLGKFFDKRVCIVCKGFGYKLTRDDNQGIVKAKCLKCDGKGDIPDE